jgi:hypothetical protein
MIPGAWEARPGSHSAVADSPLGLGSPYGPVVSVPKGSADRRGSDRERDTQRPEMAAWLEMSIVAAALLAAMLFAMWGTHFTA